MLSDSMVVYGRARDKPRTHIHTYTQTHRHTHTYTRIYTLFVLGRTACWRRAVLHTCTHTKDTRSFLSLNILSPFPGEFRSGRTTDSCPCLSQLSRSMPPRRNKTYLSCKNVLRQSKKCSFSVAVLLCHFGCYSTQI